MKVSFFSFLVSDYCLLRRQHSFADAETEDGLSMAAIAGIVTAVIAVVALLVAFVVVRTKRQKMNKAVENGEVIFHMFVTLSEPVCYCS